jgi:hypothetical protein
VKGKRNFMRRVEALAKGVDGARSNVAKDDAERSENEAAATGWGIPVFFNRLLGRAAFLERRLIFFSQDDIAGIIRRVPLLCSTDLMLGPPSQRPVVAS